jgi:MFS family permease
LTSRQADLEGDLPYNFAVHAVDAGLFGLGLGLASFVSVVPLFLATVTSSPLVIGLIGAVHPLGWHLPQLATARRVSRLHRLMPMILRTTVNERLPFFGLALLALASPRLAPAAVVIATYGLVLWIGLGGGLTATAFQAMVAKIVPAHRRGLFYGVKTAAANLLIAAGAVLAGRSIDGMGGPNAFALCFAGAGLFTVLSWIALARTREPSAPPPGEGRDLGPFRTRLKAILRGDRAFQWYVVVRVLTQVAIMATAFFIVYGVQELGMTAAMAGVLTAVFAISQTVGNPLMGWLGDRAGRRLVLVAGMACALAASLVAWAAPSLDWFYLVFILAGLAYVATWTVPLAMILEFGDESDLTAYVGLSNTLFAPSVVLAPLVGGWLAQQFGFGATFAVSALGAAAAMVVLVAFLEEPRRGRTVPGTAGGGAPAAG